MRISDWSSDVCSSDLHSYRARRIEGTAGADRRKRKGACRRNIARRQITDTGGREIKGPRALKMSGQGRAPSSLSAADPSSPDTGGGWLLDPELVDPGDRKGVV